MKVSKILALLSTMCIPKRFEYVYFLNKYTFCCSITAQKPSFKRRSIAINVKELNNAGRTKNQERDGTFIKRLHTIDKHKQTFNHLLLTVIRAGHFGQSNPSSFQYVKGNF